MAGFIWCVLDTANVWRLFPVQCFAAGPLQHKGALSDIALGYARRSVVRMGLPVVCRYAK